MDSHFDDAIERRKRSRQPLQRELRYRVMGHGTPAGNGTTLNISSNSLAFSSVGRLPVGSTIEVSVSWPAEAGSTLRLVATGVVVRSDGRVTACTMEKSSFRAEENGDAGAACPLATAVA